MSESTLGAFILTGLFFHFFGHALFWGLLICLFCWAIGRAFPKQ